MHTTSFGGTSPRVFLQNVVRSEMGYMVAWAGYQSKGGQVGGRGGEREMGEREGISICRNSRRT